MLHLVAPPEGYVVDRLVDGSSGAGPGAARQRGARGVGVLDRVGGLQTGDHVCWTYSSDLEYRRVLTTYFSEGVTRGEKVIYLAAGDVAERLLDALRDEGQPVDRLLASGQLVVKGAEETYTPGGVFDPDALLHLLRALVKEALQEGWTGLRGAGEVAWLQGRPDVENRWGGYELRVDLLASQLPYTGLCCYDLRVCDTAATLIPQAVHPLQLTPPADDGPLFGLHGTANGGLGLVGEIDCWCADDVRVLLAAAARNLHEPVLDVSQLRFADVAAMRAIAATAQELARTHGRVQLHGVSPTFRRVWRLLRLDSHTLAELN
jgi:anti-anti-sigma factor